MSGRARLVALLFAILDIAALVASIAVPLAGGGGSAGR